MSALVKEIRWNEDGTRLQFPIMATSHATFAAHHDGCHDALILYRGRMGIALDTYQSTLLTINGRPHYGVITVDFRDTLGRPIDFTGWQFSWKKILDKNLAYFKAGCGSRCVRSLEDLGLVVDLDVQLAFANTTNGLNVLVFWHPQDDREELPTMRRCSSCQCSTHVVTSPRSPVQQG